MNHATTESAPRLVRRREQAAILAELLMLVLLLFYWGSVRPPDVNESHYLTKAKHFHDPGYCPRDYFLNSSDAHYVFYATFGRLARDLPLPAAAWIGRILAYTLLAAAWFRLCWSLTPAHGVAFFSAALWVTLIDWGQMSGEWLLGGIEAKVPAYALVLMALGDLVRSRWTRLWIWLGLASAFHVLVGGWSVVAVMGSLLILPKTQRPAWRALAVGWTLGGGIALAGLVPAVGLSWDVPAEQLAAANRIYVFSRLPHHLLLSHFPVYRIVRMTLLALLLGGSFWVFRQQWTLRRVLAVAGMTLLLAASGAAIEQLAGVTDPGTALLRFYWFRSADILVPAGLALTAAVCIGRAAEGRHPGRLVVTSLTLIAVLYGAWDVRQRRLDRSIPPADWQGLVRSEFRLRQWQDVCRWCATNTRPDALFLTPVYHQTFRWWSSRSEVVNRKDIPQDARGILQWKTRLDDARWLCHIVREGTPSEAAAWAQRFQDEYEPDYWIVPHWQAVPRQLPLRYRNATYLIYEFPKRGQASFPREP